MSDEPVAVCDEKEALCRCARPPEHDGPHLCFCGGSWCFDDEGLFVGIALPGSNPGWGRR